MKQRFSFLSKSKGLALVLSLFLAFAMLLSVQIVLAADPEGFTIDSFYESMALIALGPTPPGIYTYTTVSAVTGIVGDELDVEIDNSINDGGALRQIRVTSSSGSFSYAADDSVRGWMRLTWDGADGDATAFDPVGLGGVDVTDAGVGDYTGFHIRLSADHPATLTLSVYTNGTDWSSYTFAVPNTLNTKQSFFLPFSSFTPQGAGATWTDVGAIVLYADGTDPNSASLDLSLDFVETNSTDLGDDPDTYSTNVTSSGARHVLGGNFLGASVDAELDGQPGASADGDDNNGTLDDEDGVVRYQNWTSSRAYVRVYYTQTVVGCLNGWLDWNNDAGDGIPDGDFNDVGERIIGTDAAPGGVAIAATREFTSPNLFGSLNFDTYDYYARFRVTPDEDNDNDCSTTDVHAAQQAVGPTGTANGGEVEDYFWQFGPTAVTLNNLEAKADAQNNTAALVLAATVVAALGLAGVALRRRTA